MRNTRLLVKKFEKDTEGAFHLLDSYDQCNFIADWIFKNCLNERIGTKLVREILNCVSNNNVWEMYKFLCQHTYMTERGLGTGFRIAYTYGKCDVDDFEDYIPWGEARRFIMNREEMNYLNSLPDTVTIYRGTCKDEFENKEYGTSWTINPEKANFFAYEYIMTKTEGERCVIKTEVPKESIIAYINERNEFEVLVQDIENEVSLYETE